MIPPSSRLCMLLAVAATMLVGTNSIIAAGSDSDFNRDAEHAKDLRNLRLTSDVALKLAAAALRGLAHYPVEPLINRTTTALDDDIVVTEVVRREAARILAKDLLLPGRLSSLLAQPVVVAAVAKELRGLRCIDDAASTSSVLPQEIMTSMIRQDVPPGRPDVSLNRGSGSQSKLGFEFVSSPPNHTGVQERNSVAVGGPTDQCLSDGDCPPAHYCATGTAGNSCDKCSDFHLGGGQCDDISGSCCSAAFLKQCPDNPAECGQPCRSNGECSVGEYCDSEYGCYRCSAVGSQACYDVSGNCCTDAFLRQCPDNPADCCHVDSDCPRDQFCAHDFQRPYNFCFDCSVNDPVVCHDVSGDCCSSMFLEQCPDNPADCCESDGDCPSPEVCLSTGRCGCHADEDCPVGGFCAVGASSGNFCYKCSLVTPETCYDISHDCCSPSFLEKCPDDPAGCGPLCEDDSDCLKDRICNVGHCGTRSQDKDTLLASFTPGPGTAAVAWEKLRGWTDATDPCLSPGWEGVVCIGGRIKQVVLGNDPQHAPDLGFQLGPAVGRLGSLSDLVVIGTAMSGTIPLELGQLSTLEQLSLSMNPLLSGSIPQQLGQLSSLVWLNLFNNPLLTGNIPDEIGQLSALRKLTLSNNPLVSGTLPVELGGARDLVELGIYDMPLLSGTIPAALGDLSTLLQFDLNSNPLLSGTISPELGQLSKAQSVLVFSNPLLSGTIPKQLGHGLSALLTLDVYSNPSLSGTIPASFGELFALQSLNMVSNPSLSGSIPSELGALSSLKFLDLYSNPLLSGSLPNFAGTQLVSLNAGSCSLSRLPASLPASIDHLYLNKNPIKANAVDVSTLLGSMNASTLHVLDIGFSWPVALESHVVTGKSTSHGARVKNPSPCRLATPCEFVLHMYDEDDRPATVGGLVFNLTLSFNGSRVAMSDNHDGTFTATIPDGWIRRKGGPHLFHFEHNGVEFRPMATAHNTLGPPDAADDCHNPPIDGDLCTGLRTVKFLPRACPPGSHTAPDDATGASCICQSGFVQDASNTTSVSCHRRCGADESVSNDGASCECNGRNYDTDRHGIMLCSTGGWTAHPDSLVFKDAQATRMKGARCVPCPAECTRCEDGVPTLREGWRLNSTSNGELRAQLARGKEGRTQWIFSCPYSRTDCPAINVELASQTYDDNTISCLGQHNGPLCATCMQGYSRRGSNDNSCEPCSEISDYIASQFGVAEAAFVGIVVCSMAAMVAILYGLRKQIKQLKGEIKTNQRILLGSAQVLALLPSTLELVFPPQAKPAFSFTAIAVADLRSVVRFECWGWTWYDKWIANVIGLPALAVMPIVIYWLISHLSSRRVDSDTRSAVNAEARQSCARALAFVAMLLYPQVSSTIFSALRCEALGEGATWLEVDFSVSCLDERYSRYRAAALVMVCVVPIGFPLGLLVVLLRSWRQSRDIWEAEFQHTDGEHISSLAEYHYARVQDRFGFACGDYRASCFWFEPVDLLRKLALSGLLQFVHRGTAAQCFCGSAIAFVSFGTQQWLRPYQQPGSNVLKALVDTQLFLTFLISFILRVLPQITSSEPFGAEVYGWLLLSSMMLLVTSAVVITLAQIFHRRRFKAGLLDSGIDLASVGSVSSVRYSASDDGRSSSGSPVSAMFRRMPVSAPSSRDDQSPSVGASGFTVE